MFAVIAVRFNSNGRPNVILQPKIRICFNSICIKLQMSTVNNNLLDTKKHFMYCNVKSV